MVALENVMTLVRGTVVAFLEAESRDSGAAKFSDSASRGLYANRQAVGSNVFQARVADIFGETSRAYFVKASPADIILSTCKWQGH